MPTATQRGETHPARVGLALAGGGPQGAIYEIGALRALEEALDGVHFNHLHVYVGVSAGAFLCANLANNLTTAQMCRAIVASRAEQHPFHSATFLQPATGEWLRRGASVPALLGQALFDFARNPRDASLLDSLTRLGRAVPVGLFDNEPIRAFLETIYNLKDRTDDFRRLEKRLFIVAVDLDSGEAVRFGDPEHDHVPISTAVQASTALPGLYPPVVIDGRHYVDGVLRKTLHASVALDAGADLLFCLNPLVPVDTERAVERGVMRRGRLVDRGWPTVVSQTFRTLIRSRLKAGMGAYEGRYDADIILLEPRRDDYRMFFTNIFSFASRRAVCEHAYQETRRELLRRADELEPILARHGIVLRRDRLEQERDLWRGVGLSLNGRPRHGNRTLRRLDDLLDRLDAVTET